MKTTFFIFSLFFVSLSIILTGCSNDENVEINQKALEGIWKAVHTKGEEIRNSTGEKDVWDEAEDPYYFQLKSDGTYLEWEEDEEDDPYDSGTYKIEGNKLILDPGSNDSITYTIKELTKNKLVLEDSYTDDGGYSGYEITTYTRVN